MSATSASRPELVGRDAELEVVSSSLEAAISGTPGLLVCTGEPGIGKTRLLEELAATARKRGVAVAWGSADETGGAPPYWPWQQILSDLQRVIDLRLIAAELHLETELHTVAPDAVPSGPEGPRGGAPDEARFRQLGAAATLLMAIARRTPVLLVVDDAQWADEPSLLLARHLCRAVRDERLLLALAARDTDPAGRRVLAALARERNATTLQLSGLENDAVAKQLRAGTGSEPASALVQRVRQLTGGNPLFVREVVRAAGVVGADELATRAAANLRDVMAERLSTLAEQVLIPLEAAAILGQHFSTADAQEVAGSIGVAPSAVLASLREGSTAGLVEERASGRWSFTHGLLRVALEARLDPETVSGLHRAAALMLERRLGDAPGRDVFELARHWARTGDAPDRAVFWLRRAAAEARRRLAYEDSARLYADAAAMGTGAVTDAERCELYLAAAEAWAMAAMLPRWAEASLDAAAIARDLKRPDLLAAAALVGGPFGSARFDVVTRRLCDDALSMLPPGPSPIRAKVLARLAETYIFHTELEPADRASSEALAAAEQCGDADALAAGLRARLVVHVGPEHAAERRRLTEQLVSVVAPSGDVQADFSSRLWLIDSMFAAGELQAAAAEIAALDSIAAKLAGPITHFQVLAYQAILAHARGHFARCRQLRDEAVRTASPFAYPQAFHIRAALTSALLRHAGEEHGWRDAVGYTGVPQEYTQGPGAVVPLNVAHALAVMGDLESAAEVLASLGPPRAWRIAPHVRLVCLAYGIAAGVPLGLRDLVDELRENLAPYRGLHVASGAGTVTYFGPVELWLGMAEAFLGSGDDAVRDLELAVSTCTTTGAAGFLVEAQCELASALLSRATAVDVARAEELLRGVSDSARQLGMPRFAERSEGLLTTLADASRNGGLSRREQEVAALLADGLTNRQIAERLFLSERTAQNHVQHILTKLGLANRSQVAVWVANRKKGI